MTTPQSSDRTGPGPRAWLLGVMALAVLAGGSPAPAAEPDAPTYCLAEGWPDLPEDLTLGQAAGLDIDSQGTVYVFHRGSRSWGAKSSVMARARTALLSWFTGDAQDGPIPEDTILALHPDSGALLGSFGARHFRIPHGLTIGVQDNLWVTDVGLHQVFKLAQDGRVLVTLGEAGVTGSDRSHFDGPTDVAVASDGSIYVADGYGNARVIKFSSSGDYLLEWGGRGAEPGRFNLPHGIAIDADDNLYVADRGNARIQVFDRHGTFLRQIAGPRIGRPWAVDVGRDGLLYVADGGDQDPAKHRSGVVVMTREGRVITRWSGYGREPGRLVWPHDLAVSRAADVFVGEVFDSNRIQKFQPNCTAQPPTG